MELRFGCSNCPFPYSNAAISTDPNCGETVARRKWSVVTNRDPESYAIYAESLRGWPVQTLYGVVPSFSLVLLALRSDEKGQEENQENFHSFGR